MTEEEAVAVLHAIGAVLNQFFIEGTISEQDSLNTIEQLVLSKPEISE